MRLEMRCAIWNFWNFSNLSWRVAYLKLSDETWNEMCYLKLLKLFKPIMEVANLKLSDETWNEMCYLKLLKLFQTYHGGLLTWNFQMRLEMRCAIWNFWNFSNLSWRLLTWNFQMRLEMRCAIWNLKLFKPIMEGCLLETFRWDLKWDVLFETFETWNFWNFSTHHRSYLFETFRWDFEWDMLFETFWNLKLFNPITGVSYLKLSDEIWNEICYLKHLKCLKLETV